MRHNSVGQWAAIVSMMGRAMKAAAESLIRFMFTGSIRAIHACGRILDRRK